jgi:osmotically-inducible protein OsmY
MTTGTRAWTLGLATLLVAAPAFARTDAEVKSRIEARLHKAGLDRSANVQVSVEGGVARLTGVALSYADCREVERLARKEAKRVVNVVRVVLEEPRSDKAIRKDVETSVLSWARYGPFDAIGVEVDKGIVHLTGWVDTPMKRGEIEERVARLEGVQDVHADLHLQGISRADVELRQEIYDRIYSDSLFSRFANLNDPPIRVFVERGRVTLVGTVGSELEQVKVGHIARGTLAFAVDNQVKVEGSAPEEDRRKDPTEG